VKVNLD